MQVITSKAFSSSHSLDVEQTVDGYRKNGVLCDNKTQEANEASHTKSAPFFIATSMHNSNKFHSRELSPRKKESYTYNHHPTIIIKDKIHC
jgi:hypothetical protein